MGIIEALPDRPLPRSTVDRLSEHESIAGAFPVFGQRTPNTAYGLVVATGSAMFAIAREVDGGGWEVLEKESYEDPTGTMDGVPHDEYEHIQDLQDTIEAYLTAPQA